MNKTIKVEIDEGSGFCFGVTTAIANELLKIYNQCHE